MRPQNGPRGVFEGFGPGTILRICLLRYSVRKKKFRNKVMPGVKGHAGNGRGEKATFTGAALV